jgi:hypothetical protein
MRPRRHAQQPDPGPRSPGDQADESGEASALDQAMDQTLSRESRRVKRSGRGWDALELVSGFLDLLPGPWA